MSKFKINDRVKIIGNTNYHTFQMGEEVELIQYGDGYTNSIYWKSKSLHNPTNQSFVRECDMELVKLKFELPAELFEVD